MTALLARWLANRWALPLAAILLVSAGFAAGNVWRGGAAAAALAQAKTETAQCQAARQQARADSAEAVAATLSEAASRVRATMAALAKQEAAARLAAEQFRQEMEDVPETYICGASAAERAYRRSVQQPGP